MTIPTLKRQMSLDPAIFPAGTDKFEAANVYRQRIEDERILSLRNNRRRVLRWHRRNNIVLSCDASANQTGIRFCDLKGRPVGNYFCCGDLLQNRRTGEIVRVSMEPCSHLSEIIVCRSQGENKPVPVPVLAKDQWKWIMCNMKLERDGRFIGMTWPK